MNNAILVVCDRGIGDMILSHGLLQTIKEREPDTPIDAVATERNADIARLFPEIREVMVRPGKIGSFKDCGKALPYLGHIALRIATLPGLIVKLRRNSYTTSYTLRANPKEMMVPYLAGIPTRIGYLRGKHSERLLTERHGDSGLTQHHSRDLALLAHPEHASFEVPTPRLSIPRTVVESLPQHLLEITQARDVVAICPGGLTNLHKKYPPPSLRQASRISV